MAWIVRVTVHLSGEKIDRHFLVLPGAKINKVCKFLWQQLGVAPSVVARVPYNA